MRPGEWKPRALRAALPCGAASCALFALVAAAQPPVAAPARLGEAPGARERQPSLAQALARPRPSTVAHLPPAGTTTPPSLPVPPPTAIPPEDDADAPVAPLDRHFLGSDASPLALLAELANIAPVRVRPVGTTSVVFRVSDARGRVFAWKPRTERNPRGWAAEIAAYRVSRLLGMDNVPPAVSRRLERPRLAAAQQGRGAERWAELEPEISWEDDDAAFGAAIHWIPDMHDLGLDDEAAMADWLAELAGSAPLAGERRSLLSDLSTMVVFDYVIGNFDRYSGSNLKGTADGRRVFLRDHDLGFLSHLPRHVHRRMTERLFRVERFSRRTILALRRLDRQALEAELAEDPASRERQLLGRSQLRGLEQRRQVALAHVAALVEAHGEEAVLVFE